MRAFQKRSRPQQLTLCRSLHAEALQANASEGLSQGLYVSGTRIHDPLVKRHWLHQCATKPKEYCHLYMPISGSICDILQILRKIEVNVTPFP